MRLMVRSVALAAVVVVIGCSSADADVRLPRIFSSSMVLQRQMAVPVWGWADAGEEVKVEFADQEVSSRADIEGKWMVELAAMKAGGPYDMTVSGKNTIKLTDILVGEVWICSGQSNMAMLVSSVNNAEQEVAEADYQKIRFFSVGGQTGGQPLSDLSIGSKSWER